MGIEPEQGSPRMDRRYSDTDVTVIVAGVRRSAADISGAMNRMREAFPGSTFVLSTSRDELREARDLSGFDRILAQDDPGLLIADKFDGGATDVNQVRAYVSSALAESATALAIVLRPGSFLFTQKALELWTGWERASVRPTTLPGRLLVSKFFTINPIFDERLPFQVSSQFQLGTKRDLIRFWSAAEYGLEIASWYETRPHAKTSLPRERAFRARFTPDQWLTLNYLYADDEFPIQYHNDIAPPILQAFYEQLAERFIVAHPVDIDLFDADNVGQSWSTYLNAICVSYHEWRTLLQQEGAPSLDFSSRQFWPSTNWQKRLLITAKTKVDQKLLAFPGFPKKLHRQIYD